MTIIQVAPKDLAHLISVGLATAGSDKGDPAYSCVYLASGRQAVGEEVGQTDILSTYSYNGDATAGTLSIPAMGRFARPVVIRRADFGYIRPWLTAVAKEEGYVLFSVEGTNASMQSSEDAEQNINFTVSDPTHYPIETVLKYIRGDFCFDEVADGDDLPLAKGCLTQFDPLAVSVISSLGKQMKSPVKIYRVSHPASVLLLQCGAWRGAIRGDIYSRDDSVSFPDETLGALNDYDRAVDDGPLDDYDDYDD